jgi:energy-coupling factor transporter transmembrane protein EcfT
MALISAGGRHGHGPASSLDPACRLICLALLSSSSLIGSLPLAAAIALSAFGLLRLEGLRFARILRESIFILVFALGAGILRFLSWDGDRADGARLALDSAGYGLRLLAAFLAGRLLYASTRQGELRDAATRIARRIPWLRRYDIGLSLSMVLGYIPIIFDEWRDSLEAARSRGLPRRPGIAQLTRFLSAFLRRLMLKAVSLPEALAARGWSSDRGLSPSLWRFRESLVVLACCITLLVAALRLV